MSEIDEIAWRSRVHYRRAPVSPIQDVESLLEHVRNLEKQNQDLNHALDRANLMAAEYLKEANKLNDVRQTAMELQCEGFSLIRQYGPRCKRCNTQYQAQGLSIQHYLLLE